MAVKQSKQQASSRDEKRARFSDEKKSGASPIVLIAGLFLVAALIAGAIAGFSRPAKGEAASPVGSSSEQVGYAAGSQGLQVTAATVGHDPYPLVTAGDDGMVRLEMATFDDYKAHFYTYMHDGRPIEFFILKSKDGVVRAAFNACDVCFPAKKGYHQEGDEMVCNNCGNRFPSDQINEVRGGCNPSPLDRATEGDSLLIKVEDIVRGQDYF